MEDCAYTVEDDERHLSSRLHVRLEDESLQDCKIRDEYLIFEAMSKYMEDSGGNLLFNKVCSSHSWKIIDKVKAKRWLEIIQSQGEYE